MFCGAYDYEPFVVYVNDVSRQLIEFDEFNTGSSLPLFFSLRGFAAGLTDYYNLLL